MTVQFRTSDRREDAWDVYVAGEYKGFVYKDGNRWHVAAVDREVDEDFDTREDAAAVLDK
jgi:hypothetical protein